MYDGLNLYMLEMHGEHHDDDFCIHVLYPVVRKAVRKAIISRLRRLGMEAMDKEMQTFKFHGICEPV